MNFFIKRVKTIGKICIGSFPSIGFTLLFLAVFFGCTYEMRYNYDNFGIIFLPFALALAACFYVSPTIANLSCNVNTISNFYFEGKFYEFVKWGNNSYSFSEKGGLALAFAIICFFKNLIVCPIVVVLSIIKIFYALFNSEYCEKVLSDTSLTYKSLIKLQNIILVIALLVALPTWIANYCSYQNRLFENNCSVECNRIERYIDSIDTISGDNIEIVFISLDFSMEAQTNDFQKIVCDMVISDGNDSITAEMIKIESGLNKISIRSNTGYKFPSDENNIRFNNFDLNNVTITLNVHSIIYENSSFDYKLGDYIEIVVPLNTIS
ncbi:MAG: hypothetical protein PHW00_03155 [Clostridia bacterium]|nr:hypothetical protein [Clostridia bacterium]